MGPDDKNSENEPELSARDYFEVILPALLRWKGEAATALNVAVCFKMIGANQGTWTILLRPPKAAVVEGDDWQPDLTITITESELLNMLQGKFDARKALAEGNVLLAGDLRILRRVGFLFQGGGNPVELRLKKRRASNK